MSIATVVSVIGNAWVRNPDGSLIELSEGMTLEAGQILITATDGLVELDLGEGELVYFAANQSLFLSSQMSASAFVPVEQNTVASENIDLVLQALEEDGDLLEVLDPTAAGPEEAGGTGMGARFTRVERVEPEAEEFVYNYSLNENDATFSTNPFPSNAVDAALESNATANNTPETVPSSNTTPPNAPVVSDVTNNTDTSGANTGTTVVGEAEPGTTVEIRDDSGNVVGSGTTDENGDFEIVVEPALDDGEDYDVVAIDNAGNESATGTVNGGTVITGDTTAPDAPTVDSVTNNTDSEGNSTGTTVVGEAEPGTTVEIRDDSGNVVGSGTTDENGDFEVVVEPALADGEDYAVVAIDNAGNESATGTVNGGTVIVGDTTAPAISDVTVVQQDTNDVANGEADQTVVTFTGDDTNATYLVTGPNGETPSVTDNGDGTYTVTFEPALATDAEITITATDTAGNSSDAVTGTVPSEVIYVGSDNTAPTVTDITVEQQDISNPANGEADQTVVTFTGDDANADYAVTGPNNESATVVANGDGTYTATFSPALTAGSEVTIAATDAAGNNSDIATSTVPREVTYAGNDTTAPDAPTVDSVTNNTDSEGNSTGTTVVGEAEPGTTIEIRDDSGNVVGSGTTDENGDFELVVEPALEDGEDYDVVAIDNAGNESATGTVNGGTVITGDTTAPTVTDITVEQQDISNPANGEADQTVVTFTGDDANADYAVTGPNNETATVVANGDGTYTATFSPALTAGSEVTIAATDAAGNNSDIATSTVPIEVTYAGNDTTAPETNDGQNSIGLVGDTVINNDNSSNVSLGGQVEQGGTVNSIIITDSAGNTVTIDSADIAVNTDGTVEANNVDLSDLTDGALTIDMSVTDAAGNTGIVEASALLDTTANASINITDVSQANAGAFVVNGATEGVEAGQVISITISDNDTSTADIETTAVVQADGTYSTTVDLTGLTDGSIVVLVTTSDQAGNTATSSSTVQLDAVQSNLTVAVEWTNETLPLNEALAKDPTLRPSVSTGHDKVILTSMGNLDAEDGQTYTVWRVINGTDEPVTGTLSSVGNSGVTETLTVEPGTATFITSPASNTHQFSWDDGSLTKAAGNQTFSQSQLVETGDQVLSIDGQTIDVAEGSTVTIVITDSNGTEMHVESSVGANGNYSIENIDVSSLVDGPLTIVSNASDNNGNLVQSNVATVVLDTTNITPTVNDVGYITDTVSGLYGEYWSYSEGSGNANLTNVAQVDAFIANNDSATSFTATTVNYGPIGDGGLGGHGKLQSFLGGDAGSLAQDPANSSDAIIRLTGQLELNAGNYQFRVTADDGYSIRVNGEVVAEADRNQGPRTDTYALFELEGDGPHSVEIVYWDQGGNAVLEVELRPEGGEFEYLGESTGAFYNDYNEALITANTEDLVIDANALLANTSDANGDTLSIHGVGNVSGGTVALDDRGNIVFTPEAGFTGEASFTYTVTDGRPGGENTAAVTVFVTSEAAITAISPATTEGVNVVEALWNELNDGDFGTIAHAVNTASREDAVDTPTAEATRNLSITSTNNSNETHLLNVGDRYLISWEQQIDGDWQTMSMQGTVTRSDGHWASDATEVRDVVVFSGTVDGQGIALVIDSEGLTASSGYYTNDQSSTTVGFNQYEIVGTASAGALVDITSSDGSVIAQSQADSAGHWTVLLPADTSTTTLTATATDVFNTTSTVTSTITIGTDSVDTLASTVGDDLLLGGFGADVFAWQLGDQGTEDTPTVDRVMDFNLADGDSLSLADLLQGEQTDNLSDYLHFRAEGENTVIEVSHQGNGEVTQLIQLNGIELASLGSNDQEIITMLLDNGHLRIDQ